MNESNDQITGELLDHLVEDELGLIQRKRIIASLDSEPNGWRRCALAFLEKQSWQRSFRQFVADKSCDDKSVLPTKTLNDKRTRSTRNWKTLGAMVVVALLAGIGIGRGWSIASSPIADRVQSPVNKHESMPGSNANEALPDAEDSSGFQLVGLATFSDGNNTGRAMPILSGSTLNEESVYRHPMPLSDYEVRKLERKGWKVRQARQVVTVELVDGRRLSIPIDAVKYEFVGHEVY